MNNIIDLIKKALCALGFHSPAIHDKWTPSIHAPIVTAFEQTHTCRRCKQRLAHYLWEWNGSEMVNIIQQHSISKGN